jgi:hypothetical protein
MSKEALFNTKRIFQLATNEKLNKRLNISHISKINAVCKNILYVLLNI